MKRRQFIGLSAYIAAAVVIPFSESCSTVNSNAAVSEPVILLHILNTKSILETGQAYLEQYPEENTKNKLRDLLLDKNFAATSSGANAVRSYLGARTAEDFNSGKTVVVNGWIFSHTEARQCALFALLQS